MLVAALTAFLLLLAIAPGADAKSAKTKTDEAPVLAATPDCSSFLVGRFRCQPENFTTENTDLYVSVYAATGTNGCSADWVTTSTGGGCEPGVFLDPGHLMRPGGAC